MIAADMRIHSPRWSARSEGRQPLTAFHIGELGEPSQSLCHDDSRHQHCPEYSRIVVICSAACDVDDEGHVKYCCDF